MKIPKSFRLMGHQWRVRVIAAKDWKDDEAVGLCSFANKEIRILKADRSTMEHTYIHECMHAALEAMNSKLYDREDFVDPLAGLFHQILSTAE